MEGKALLWSPNTGVVEMVLTQKPAFYSFRKRSCLILRKE